MKKRYIILVLSIITTIAYFDMVDSFKHIDKIVSNMLKLDTDIKNEIDTSWKTAFKIQK